MNNKHVNKLVNVLLKINNQDAMLDLLKGLFTLNELEEIARRLQIVVLLKKGLSPREVAEKLKVGIATVTRGSKEIQQGRFSNI